jgi:membrane-bound lytic murein transglycosylase D
MTEMRLTGMGQGRWPVRAARALVAVLLASCATFGRSARTAAKPTRVPVADSAAAPVTATKGAASVVAPAAPPVAPPVVAPSAAPATKVSADSAPKPASDSVDITKEAARVFGDSISEAAVVAAVGAAPVWDIDVRSYETRERVQHFVGLFSGAVRGEFEKSLHRETRYGPLIRQKLREGGLPEDMMYLALVESWYDPNAYSKAAAVGIWQLMAGMGRSVGLRVDWWVDERRDPVRSTQGAVRILRWLRAQFGSLYLAAAAYDGGDGRVARGLVRYASNLDGVEGEDRFFTLADTKYLRQETRDYVPKIIAAALVGKEPARYGVKVDSLPALVFDTVHVAGATPLAAIASASRTTAGGVAELNPHILRGMTPPGDSFWVRVPPGAAKGFSARFSALAPDERVGVHRVLVTTRKAETMLSIAHGNGLTAQQLGWYNPKAVRLKNGNLAAGQSILVPTRQTLSAARAVPNPSIERYPRRTRSKAPAKGSPSSAATKKATPAPKKAPTER